MERLSAEHERQARTISRATDPARLRLLVRLLLNEVHALRAEARPRAWAIGDAVEVDAVAMGIKMRGVRWRPATIAAFTEHDAEHGDVYEVTLEDGTTWGAYEGSLRKAGA